MTPSSILLGLLSVTLLLPQTSFCKKGQVHKGHRNKHKSRQNRGPPNIVFILADDLGYNDVPWHNPAIVAPHLQHLADQGVILEQNYVQPKCAPSRAALLTGRYPYHIGRQHESLPPTMPTGVSLKYKLLPQVLKERGYRTHAVGKWHLGYCDWDYTPTRRGFDSFFGFYTHGEDYYDRISSDSTKRFFGYDFRDGENITHEGQGEYSANLFSRKAVDIIQDSARGRDKNKPLFLYLSFQSIHKPIQVPDKYARLYQPYGKLEKGARRQGMISALDEAVMNVTLALRRVNKYRDTVMVFMSDNGGAEKGSNWPLRGGKNSVWEGGTKSVAFVHYPRIKKKLRRRVSGDLMHAVDWYNTILGMTEPDHGEELRDTRDTGDEGEEGDGHNMWPTITRGEPGPRTELVYNINDALRFTAAVREGKWKLIWGYPDGMRSNVERKRTRKSYAQTMYEATSSDLVFLFDLEKDPNETMNLAKTERKVTKRMMKKIRALIRSGEVVKPDTPFLRERSLPKYWEGVVSPGWCKAKQ